MENDQSSKEFHVRSLLRLLGHDVDREGLTDTPRRVVKFLSEFTQPEKPPFEFTMFDGEGANEMVVQTGIPLVSLCEHHLAPFTGYATVGYIPGKRIVGLSKLARSVEYFARRLQNQERVTRQVAQFLQERLEPVGVGVIVVAEHSCMTVRGVRAHGAMTTTSCLLGAFKEGVTRSEFLGFHHASRPGPK